MLQRALGTLAFAATFMVAAGASAHIQLMEPAPRYVYNQNGQKTGPCGMGSTSGDVTTYAPGATLLVQWNETVDHPGYFRISVDSDGGQDDLVDPTDYDDFYVAPSVLEDDIADGGGSTFSQEITLPDVECELCTLQLIQVMTDKPPWGPAGGDDIYYWCADIRISNEPDPTTSATTTSATTTSGGGGDPSGGTGGGTTSGGGESAQGGEGTDGGEDEGCAVRGASSPGSSFAWLSVLGLSLAWYRRRSQRSRRVSGRP